MPNLVYSFQVIDADGNKAAVTIYGKHASATSAQLVTWGTDLSEVLDAAIDGKVLKASLLIDVPIGSVKTDPVAGSNIQETALLTYDADGTPYNFSVDVPAWLAAGFSGKTVDQTNAAVQAFRDYLTTVTNTIVGADRYGNALVALVKGRKTFRKYRKQASRS